MNGRDWLRAVALRQRKKAPTTAAATLPVRTPGAQLPGTAAVRDWGATSAEAAAGVALALSPLRMPATQAPGALPGGDAMWTGGGQQCGCEVRYSDCRCAREGGRP